jgi:hypothetical protein
LGEVEPWVKKLAILKVQRVILTVFTVVTFFLRLFRLESDYARGQSMGRNIFLGWSDRKGFGGNEVGSLVLPPFLPPPPAQHGVLPMSKIHPRVTCNLCVPKQLPFTVGVNGAVNPIVNCVFHALFTLPRWKKRLRFVAIGTHPLLKRPRKRENAKESFGPELQESVGSFLMTEGPPSPPYLLGNIEKGKR